MGTIWPCFKIDSHAEYSWKKTHVVYLVGSAWSCIMSCSNRIRPLLRLSTEHNWWDWAEHSRKNAHYYSRHDKLILLHDNARPHIAAPVKIYLETLKWGVLPTRRILQTLFLPFVPIDDAWPVWAALHIIWRYQKSNCIDWIASKDEAFFRLGIHMLLERWKKVVASDGHYYE